MFCCQLIIYYTISIILKGIIKRHVQKKENFLAKPTPFYIHGFQYILYCLYPIGIGIGFECTFSEEIKMFQFNEWTLKSGQDLIFKLGIQSKVQLWPCFYVSYQSFQISYQKMQNSDFSYTEN